MTQATTLGLVQGTLYPVSGIIQDWVNSSLLCLYKWPHQSEDDSRTREKVIETKPWHPPHLGCGRSLVATLNTGRFFFFNCGILKSHTAALSNNQLIQLFFLKKTMWKNFLDMPSFNCDFINILCEPLYLWQAPTKKSHFWLDNRGLFLPNYIYFV